MDRHLNVFVPYERPSRHEDQLTRAAMIVMRAVPMARDAVLARIGAPVSARLPGVEFDMQTRHVANPLPLDAAEHPAVRRLISVFLSPDEGLNLSGEVIEERLEEQRLDGVLRFGDDLIVVIESKVVGQAPSAQAKQLRLRGREVEEGAVVGLGWHNLLEDWWNLLERGLLSPAEHVVMEDLVAFAEEHFSHLLPFTTLARAGDNELRVQRRLMALLREATGSENVIRRPPYSAQIMLDDVIGTKSTQRISLVKDDQAMTLCTWPGELKPQATALYRTTRAARLVELAAEPEWEAIVKDQRNSPTMITEIPYLPATASRS